MSKISLIAAIDENRGLGYKNKLLCHLPVDLKNFKTITLGKPIVMGRKTFESIGKILPGRMNIVLSQQKMRIPGAIVVDSLQKALEFGQHEPEIIIIGGSSVFEQAINLAARIYLTLIHHQFIADSFFPELNLIWHCNKSEMRKKNKKNPYDVTFFTYERFFL